jgi:hypothetical protein
MANSENVVPQTPTRFKYRCIKVKPPEHSIFLALMSDTVRLAYGYCQYHEKQKATDTYPVESPTAVAAEPNGHRGLEDYVGQPTYVQCVQDSPVRWIQLLAAAELTSLCEGPHPAK